MFGDLFGGFFDFNGDGKITWEEELLTLAILEDICKEDTEDSSEEFVF